MYTVYFFLIFYANYLPEKTCGATYQILTNFRKAPRMSRDATELNATASQNSKHV